MEIIGSVTSIEHGALTGGFSGQVSRSGQHAPDAGQEHYDREFLLRLAGSERELLGEIDAALTRIDDGTYGVCEETGEPIGLARLEAKPWARLCIEAARRRDG